MNGRNPGFKIEKQNDSDYHVRKQKPNSCMVLENLIIVLKKYPEPSWSANLSELQEIDAKAKAHIGLSLSSEQLELMRDDVTAYNT